MRTGDGGAVRHRTRSGSIVSLSALFLAVSCAKYSPLPLAPAPPLAISLPEATGLPDHPLRVDEVVALALARNPDLIAARTRRAVARAQVVQAGVHPNPSLTAAILPLISGAGTGPAWNLGLAQDIKSLLVYKPKLRAARDAAHQVDADLLWQEWQVAGQARQLAGDIVLRDRQRPLLQQAFALLEHRNTVAQHALAARNITLVTAAPSASGFQSARANLQTFEQTQLQARHKLNALLGLAPDVPVPLAPTIDIPPLDVAATRASIATLPQRRPDLLALRFGYASQDENLRAAIRGQFPDLVLGGSVSSDSSQVINAGPNVQLGLPIFDRNQGNIGIAQATRAQLNAEYSARLAAATGEVGGLLTEMEQLRAQLAVVQRDLPAVRLAAQRVSVAFARSAIDERAFVDLITARFAKEQEVLNLQLALLDRQVAIETLVGAGLPTVETLGLTDPGTKGAAQ
jgi:outer membrane protein TolC